ncbi:MAG: YihY family inner membrane protein [Mariprofundaceae bacterium]|nr:YihY family inner membrane protein [Mariprofundaceae bacterium]
MPPPVKEQLTHLMEMDVAEIASLPALKRYTLGLLRFIWRTIQRFIEDKCIQRASALGYASLLAIVPLVALGFSIFTSFQAFDVVAGNVRGVLLEYLLPTSQMAVEGYLDQVADKATALSIFGILGLLFTATALLNTMEEAFNDIWRISRARSWLSKFITFWSVLTLSPILIGASITITSYFVALPVIRDVAEGASMVSQVPFLAPWLISSVAMTTLYIVLPNTPVPYRYAILGGLVSGALFELTKLGFAFYITELANYEKLYGALGTLPVFLIWLYLIWVVVLIGAEVVFCLQHPEQSRQQGRIFFQPGIQKFYSHLILLRTAQAMQSGESLYLKELTHETDIPDNILQELMDRLCESGLLKQVVNKDPQGAWVLGREADKLSLNTIHQALSPDTMEVPEAWQQTPIGRTLSGIYFRMNREQDEILESITVRDLLEREQKEIEDEEEVITQ